MQGFPSTVYLVYKNTLRIAAISILVSIYCINVQRSFFIRIEGNILDPSKSVLIDAEMELGSEFCRFTGLASYNGTHVWPANADNPVLNFMSFIFVHVKLLLIKLMNCSKSFGILCRQHEAFFNTTVHKVNVAPYIIQLSFGSTADLLHRRPFGFCKDKILLMSDTEIYSGLINLPWYVSQM